MKTKIGINGFGRIGRLVFRAISQYHPEELAVVAVNDLTSAKTNAHLLKYDSNYGQYPSTIESTDDAIIVNGNTISVTAERDPENIPWKDLEVDLVIECTGLFTDASKSAAHLNAGGNKVIISAPAKNEDLTVVLGVNDDKYDPFKHRIISNASCTTNCIAPVVKVLHENFGMARGLMTTIHAYTNDQRILDISHADLRRARAAAMSIIPTTTGAAKAVTQVIPELQGKLHGMSLRVPTSTVSIVDLVADLEQEVTADEVNQSLKTASEGPLQTILGYCDEPLVSVDYKQDPHSSVIDALSTMVIDGTMIKILAWYDNEWGYSCRIADLAALVARKG